MAKSVIVEVLYTRRNNKKKKVPERTFKAVAVVVLSRVRHLSVCGDFKNKVQ